MKSLLINTLESLGYPVYLQGTYPDDEEYPESLITFFTLSSDDASHYDNEPSGIAWRYQVIFYSINPMLVESVPNEIRNKLKSVGFIPQGRGRDIPSDVPTHTGCAMEFYYLDMEVK